MQTGILAPLNVDTKGAHFEFFRTETVLLPKSRPEGMAVNPCPVSLKIPFMAFISSALTGYANVVLC